VRGLAVRGGALGDFVVTLPALAELRRRVDHLTLVATPAFAALAPDLWDEVVDVRSAAALWLFGDVDPPSVPDVALAYTPGVAERLRALGTARVLAADPRPSGPAHLHFFSPLREAFGATPTAPHLRPDPSAVERVRARLPGTSPVVLAVGAGSPAKVWPHFASLAKVLSKESIEHVILTGPQESPEGWGPTLTDIALPEVVALASLARAWAGNDSGPTHLARAVGARTLALFGPTDPTVWAPPGATVFPVDSPPSAVAQWCARG
jgi:ADP-heptose:LPS heptosyltransferase